MLKLPWHQSTEHTREGICKNPRQQNWTHQRAKVLEEQGAYRKKRSCVDQIFTVRQPGEKVIERNKRIVMMCVDLVYDKVDRGLLWQVLNSYGVSGRLGRAMRSLYKRCQACLRVLGQNSDWFGVKQEVRQGCVMSLWLFNQTQQYNCFCLQMIWSLWRKGWGSGEEPEDV